MKKGQVETELLPVVFALEGAVREAHRGHQKSYRRKLGEVAKQLKELSEKIEQK